MTGDQDDILARIKAVLPPWFGDDIPILNAVLTGLAWAWAFAYSLYSYAKLQTRIATATDGWLDMIAYDFFGTSLLRNANQSDASFRARIIINLFRPRGTRASIVQVLEDLTGRTPLIFEPTNPSDTGGYSQPQGLAYSAAGGYGSMLMPWNGFVKAYRPAGSGIPLIAGYGISTGAYSTASYAEYCSTGMITDAVSDSDIYAAIDSVKPAGTTVWVDIAS